MCTFQRLRHAKVIYDQRDECVAYLEEMRTVTVPLLELYLRCDKARLKRQVNEVELTENALRVLGKADPRAR